MCCFLTIAFIIYENIFQMTRIASMVPHLQRICT
jgi:hypothetical protein